MSEASEPEGQGLPGLPRIDASLPLRALSAVMNQATGVVGRNRPLYPLNLLDRLRGPGNLAGVVSGKVVVVTGASSGIGAAAARRIGAAGGEVMMIARGADQLAVVAEEIEADGGRAASYPADLSDPEKARAACERIAAEHGPPQILINNAGLSIRRSIMRSLDRFGDYERTIQLNYLGAVQMTLALLPAMIERESGHVVNVSSTGVPVRVPRFSAYVASKAALDAFTDCAAAELAPAGIRFTTIHMPLVRTPMIEPTKMYRGMPSISAEQAADRIEDALVHQPRRIGTPYSELATLSSAISPAGIETLRSLGYRLAPGSGG